jgi:hypothetical protein
MAEILHIIVGLLKLISKVLLFPFLMVWAVLYGFFVGGPRKLKARRKAEEEEEEER